MSKKMCVSVDFIKDVSELVYRLKYGYDEDAEPVVRRIEKHLEEKYEAINKRLLYTKSKMAQTELEREEARQEYYDLVGIQTQFRYTMRQPEERKMI